MEKQTKRFEDWKEVDCEECEYWWTSSCDGVSKGSKLPCNSFLATRRVIIPEQIKSLQRTNKRLRWAIVLLSLAMVVHHIALLFN